MSVLHFLLFEGHNMIVMRLVNTYDMWKFFLHSPPSTIHNTDGGLNSKNDNVFSRNSVGSMEFEGPSEATGHNKVVQLSCALIMFGKFMVEAGRNAPS
jgi:hypothetical protein